MKIAVEGCCHGELDKIYETLEYLQKRNDMKVDILFICGDFQAVRNSSDLQCMAVPQKYQKLNTFYKYYSGEKVAPVLTVFIGGNHEASNFLQELPYGGWVAKNIYYMGYANIIQFGGIRIAGLSGIYNGKNYTRGHFERAPYNESTKRSVYHVRNLEVFRFKQVSRPIDIFLSHDWPRGIYNYGNVKELLRKKSFFAEEIEENKLGSEANEELLHVLKPGYWFAAHLHVKFPAIVQHKTENSEEEKLTKFLSLDKCLPRRNFLQVIDIPHDNNIPLKLQLDPEWLSIIKQTNHLLNLGHASCYMPGIGSNERYDFKVTGEDIQAIKDDFGGDLTIPDNFEETVPPHDYNQPNSKIRPGVVINPQTTLLCTMLDLTDPNAVFLGKDSTLKIDTISAPSPDDLDLDDEDDVDDLDSESDVNNSVISTYESFSGSVLNNSELSSESDVSFSSVNPADTTVDEEDEIKEILELQKAERISDSDKGSDDETTVKNVTSTTSASKHTSKSSINHQLEASLELNPNPKLEFPAESLITVGKLEQEMMSPTRGGNSSQDSSAEEGSVKSDKRASDSDESPTTKRVKMKRRNIVMYSDQEDEGK